MQRFQQYLVTSPENIKFVLRYHIKCYCVNVLYLIVCAFTNWVFAGKKYKNTAVAFVSIDRFLHFGGVSFIFISLSITQTALIDNISILTPAERAINWLPTIFFLNKILKCVHQNYCRHESYKCSGVGRKMNEMMEIERCENNCNCNECFQWFYSSACQNDSTPFREPT